MVKYAPGTNLMKELKIERIIPEEVKTSRFVNDLVIQHQHEYFTLSFFEIMQPLILGETEEELAKALDDVEKVEANCIIRLTLPPHILRQFIDTMNASLQTYEATYSSNHETEG
jgi:hypothetical protein